jgi:hypothetical protein
VETGSGETASSASQSGLPLRMSGGCPNGAVPRHSRGPVSVSIHGMRASNGDLGSCLQGRFSTHGFCTCRGAGSACRDRLCRGRDCNTAGFGSSCSRGIAFVAVGLQHRRCWLQLQQNKRSRPVGMTGRGLQLCRLSAAIERSALTLGVTRCGRCARGHRGFRTGW